MRSLGLMMDSVAPVRAVGSTLIFSGHSKTGVRASKIWNGRQQVSVPVGKHGSLASEGKEGKQSNQLGLVQPALSCFSFPHVVFGTSVMFGW